MNDFQKDAKTVAGRLGQQDLAQQTSVPVLEPMVSESPDYDLAAFSRWLDRLIEKDGGVDP